MNLLSLFMPQRLLLCEVVARDGGVVMISRAYKKSIRISLTSELCVIHHSIHQP